VIDEPRKFEEIGPSGSVGTRRPGGSLEDEVEREPSRLRRFLKILGPGLITGASDDDPSGIGTYAMAGAQAGYAPLWTALLTFPLMASVQYICAKIGLVTGRGIAGLLRRHYGAKLAYAVIIGLMVANTINAGADLLAIAAGLNLLIPIPTRAMVAPVGVLILGLQIWGSYRLIANTFKWLTLALFAYIGSVFFARPDWHAVLSGTFVPTIRFDSMFLATLVAILGTTISPYLFFWQASQEVEEEISRGRTHLWQRKGATDGELKYAALDINTGMLFSNVVMYFVILANAATLHQAGITNIGTATEAAAALRPIAGEGATVFMALGLIGTGLLAVPILTGSAAYAVCETFGWKCSLDAKPWRAKEFYLIVAVSTIAALLMHLIGINEMQALFWTAVINGFLAPPLLVVILLISNNKAIMGQRVNTRALNVAGWITAVLMFAAAGGLVLTWIRG
jgi:NRAMP (natural resistance-associated macrophage protein)-like metal ion transporter